MMNRLRRSGTATSRKGSTANPLPSTPDSLNLNHLAGTEYATRSRLILELRDDILKLDMGLNLKLDFPRLVVIGDQSSGKSSLVEAVSGISVPRDSGTCTRCPMECIMRSTTDPWSCSISLQFDQEGRRTVHSFGGTIYARSNVEIWIRRAQAAVLSPHRPATDFLTMSEHTLKTEVDPKRLQFSGNSVRVDIMDPDSPNLDFVDLPGIIHAVDATLGEEVVEMVKYFIQPENTVILIVMPMTSDWQTQMAVRLARDADPEGDRTIGILTKPDGLQDGDTGSREAWRKTLTGEDAERRTKHGYYCVRLPNDSERKGGREKAQNIAEDFFNSTAPWNQMQDRSRFGVPNFVQNISALLIELIEKYLPTLEKEVNRLLDECLRKIAKLPPVLDKAASTEIHLRISAFCQAFKDAVFGREHREFVQGNKRRYARFSQDISATKPSYTTYAIERVAGTWGGPCLDLEAVRRVKEGTITWELPPHVPFDATVQLVEMFTDLWPAPSLECFDDVLSNSIQFGNKLLREHFGQYSNLFDFVEQLIGEERDRCRINASKILNKVLELESRPLYTQNIESLMSERNNWLIANAPQSYSVLSISARYREQHEKYYQELDLMAGSYAYFQIAHKRIIDYVPLTIEHELNQTFVNNLQPLLFSHITRAGETPGRLEDLIQEDSALENRRRKLETRKADLLKIKKKLDTFWSLGNTNTNVSPSTRARNPYSQAPGSNARRGSFVSTDDDYHSVAADSVRSVATSLSFLAD